MRHVKLRPDRPVDAKALKELIDTAAIDMKKRIRASSSSAFDGALRGRDSGGFTIEKGKAGSCSPSSASRSRSSAWFRLAIHARTGRGDDCGKHRPLEGVSKVAGGDAGVANRRCAGSGHIRRSTRRPTAMPVPGPSCSDRTGAATSGPGRHYARRRTHAVCCSSCCASPSPRLTASSGVVSAAATPVVLLGAPARRRPREGRGRKRSNLNRLTLMAPLGIWFSGIGISQLPLNTSSYILPIPVDGR